ncbi:DUF969 family protein [Schleiferilactobacillus harbinensis]|jgi:uncharacterized membrane protein|uniref:DUF969 domain-containing protein n=3 Tax=Schleiferilactobacillus harbinensis TaxID=304207 RepID=A0A510U1B3_9LACO|nr:DUF969 domain-containing protein [Schleiferilactobacillus harbinensis]KRM29401.1 membrane protein [Schleiferilactobacillus harbinensis DSM 16991]MBO3091907.1 DUF969 domain-containing protein [Schleiferilactobacillus harbinensis]MCI1688434.1 DUF969 domain-containing protein [Schleiferilactobacillus harbinensis]MCI1783361.1 DUF969 domain-containing protein [Schleiferilactobacillus harbinensis]MCI1849712.1 DUF969 domain-containing protein [Schleiferilactobacillus harbinensis]
MEYLKLLGIVIIVLGFAFKWDTVAVVVIAALATGLLAGMDIPTLLTTLGQSFVQNRVVSLFFLTLPMIGLVESHGLKEVAVNGIQKMKSLTASRILNLYLIVRELGGVFGISLSGQVQFVRPLITPMVTAAAEVKRPLTEKDLDEIKGRSAAVDNFGNFFAQNLFVASGGVLLIVSTMTSLKHPVTGTQIVLYTIPVAVVTLVTVALYNIWFDRRFNDTKEGN